MSPRPTGSGARPFLRLLDLWQLWPTLTAPVRRLDPLTLMRNP